MSHAYISQDEAKDRHMYVADKYSILDDRNTFYDTSVGPNIIHCSQNLCYLTVPSQAFKEGGTSQKYHLLIMSFAVYMMCEMLTGIGDKKLQKTSDHS